MIIGHVVSSQPINNTENVSEDIIKDNEEIIEDIQPEVVEEKEETVDDLTKTFKSMFDAFSESIPEGSHQQKTAKGFFKKFSNYIGGEQFKNDLAEKSEKYKLPPKQIAKNFFAKVLGVIGDILGIVINTVCGIVDLAVTLLATLLHGAVTVINKAGNALCRLVSLNQTNIATA